MYRNAQLARVALLLLATLGMRAVIPDGYMPSRLGSGTLFELCPSGVPEGFIEALAGTAKRHHHHGHNSGDEAHFDASQCPIGHFLSFAMAVGDTPQPQLPEVVPGPAIRWQAPAPASAQRIAQRSRGPPTA